MDVNNPSNPLNAPLPEVPPDFPSYNQINDRRMMMQVDELKACVRDLQNRMLALAGMFSDLKSEEARAKAAKAVKA